MTMKEAILDCVRTEDWVVIPELADWLERDFSIPADQLKGDTAWGLANGNIFFGVGMSDQFAKALEELVQEHKMFLWPTKTFLDELAYSVSGGIPNLPLARRPPKRGYKDPHWLPVFLRTIPLGKEKTEQEERTVP